MARLRTARPRKHPPNPGGVWWRTWVYDLRLLRNPRWRFAHFRHRIRRHARLLWRKGRHRYALSTQASRPSPAGYGVTHRRFVPAPISIASSDPFAAMGFRCAVVVTAVTQRRFVPAPISIASSDPFAAMGFRCAVVVTAHSPSLIPSPLASPYEASWWRVRLRLLLHPLATRNCF